MRAGGRPWSLDLQPRGLEADSYEEKTRLCARAHTLEVTLVLPRRRPCGLTRVISAPAEPEPLAVLCLERDSALTQVDHQTAPVSMSGMRHLQHMLSCSTPSPAQAHNAEGADPAKRPSYRVALGTG
jgi:hypothetical protein